MRDDVRPGFRWPFDRDDRTPSIYDGEAPYESLWHERHEDVYGEQVDLVTPIEEPREWAEVLSDLAIDAGWLIAGIVIGLVLARTVGGGV